MAQNKDVQFVNDLNSLAQEALLAEQEVDRLSEKLKEAKARLREIVSDEMPGVMADMNCSSITFLGKTFTVESKVVGSFPKKPEEVKAAIQWLEENGGAGIIRTQLVADFPVGEKDLAINFGRQIQNSCKSLLVKEFVHPQTLAAFARDRVEKGEKVKFKEIGLETFPIVKIKEQR